MYNITDVVVVNSGDSIENLYMRDNQSYDCEFNLNEQIVYATKLLYGFCTSVSEFANIEFVSVGGNHNRGNGSKNANVEGDNSNIIMILLYLNYVVRKLKLYMVTIEFQKVRNYLMERQLWTMKITISFLEDIIIISTYLVKMEDML